MPLNSEQTLTQATLSGYSVGQISSITSEPLSVPLMTPDGIEETNRLSLVEPTEIPGTQMNSDLKNTLQTATDLLTTDSGVKTFTSSKPITQFLNKTYNNWELSMAYPKIWGINFESNNKELTSDINSVLKKYGNIHGFNPQFYQIYKEFMGVGSENTVFTIGTLPYMLLATGASVPDEQVNIVTPTYDIARDNNGILTPRISSGIVTNPTRVFNVSFFETNIDFIDNLIRPWLVAMSHIGLLKADGIPDLTCTITLDLYAKSSPSIPRYETIGPTLKIMESDRPSH